MNQDIDLKRLYDAQREVDEALAPDFDDIESAIRANHELISASADRRPRGRISYTVAAVAATVTIVIVMGLAASIITPRSGDPDILSASHEMQRLNRACDDLLARLEGLDSELTNENADTLDSEMNWQTVSDTLIRFDALSFN